MLLRVYLKDKEFMRRRTKEIQQLAEKQHITQDVLLGLLGVGALLAVAVVAPGAMSMLQGLGKREKSWEKYYDSSVKRGVERLWRRGLVKVVETEEGFVVQITKKGKTELLRFNLEAMSIPTPERWDRKWRMVFFDIFTTKDSIRREFSRRLRTLGFYPMQKSVYVYPYPCSKEIQFLREIMQVPHEVKLAMVERLDNDEDLRKIFGLKA